MEAAGRSGGWVYIAGATLGFFVRPVRGRVVASDLESTAQISLVEWVVQLGYWADHFVYLVVGLVCGLDMG